jgi:hypothetical protein
VRRSLHLSVGQAYADTNQRDCGPMRLPALRRRVCHVEPCPTYLSLKAVCTISTGMLGKKYATLSRKSTSGPYWWLYWLSSEEMAVHASL